MKTLKTGAGKLGLHLTPQQLEQFNTYYQELIDWNQRMNLTRITDYKDVQVKHFLDSLTVVVALPERVNKYLSVIDVGTGAGLPGLPLKILWPDISLTLLEATAKKARFLENVINRLRLKNVAIVVGRAEEIAHDTRYRERFDLVLSRAVAALPTLVELTLPFCRVGGIFVAQKKGGIEREVEQATGAIATLGGSRRETKKIDIDEFDNMRYLVVIDKIKETLPEYPRRTGVPAKRPLR